MTEFKTYACNNCGSPFPAVAPDDIHTVILSSPCPKGDSIEIPYECRDCHHRNTKYWDKTHEGISVDRVSIS
jgi:hypothetical protein